MKKYADLSPYQYTNNSPISYVDQDGLERYFYALTYDNKNGGRPVLTYTGKLERFPTLGEAFLTIFNRNIKNTGDVPEKGIFVSLPSGDSKSFKSFNEFWKWQKTLTPQSERQQGQAKAEYAEAREQSDVAIQILVNEAYFRYDMSDGKFDLDAPPDMSNVFNSEGSSAKSTDRKAIEVNSGNPGAAKANTSNKKPNYENHGSESLDIPSMGEQIREQKMARGAVRAAKFSESWENASLTEMINKFTPGAKGAEIGGKTIFTTAKSNFEIIYDNGGNYFRIAKKNAPGRRVYTDLDGTIPNNKMVNGRTTGRSQGEYNEATHFNNTDKHE
jgi:hypothetical protein